LLGYIDSFFAILFMTFTCLLLLRQYDKLYYVVGYNELNHVFGELIGRLNRKYFWVLFATLAWTDLRLIVRTICTCIWWLQYSFPRDCSRSSLINIRAAITRSQSTHIN